MAEERTNEMTEELVLIKETGEQAQKPETGELAKEKEQEAEGRAEEVPAAATDENWRMDRDAAAMAREKLQADSAAAKEEEKPLSWAERRRKEKEEANAQRAAQKEAQERQKREAQEEKERQKREAQEEKERQKREAQEEKERQKRLAQEDKQRKQQEKREAKAVVKQERRKEIKSLWHTAEFALLVTFIVLAIDQAGIYGFLFVWLFVAVMVASIALLLLGIGRAARKKRSGIIFFAAVAGIILCTAWFIFLVSSQGLGLGPIPN